MTDRQVARNAVLAVTQAVVSGVVLFLLYKFLLKTLGPERVGIWATVFAMATAARVSELGFTASTIRYTAQHLARNDSKGTIEMLQTVAITIGIALPLVLAALFPLFIWLIKLSVPTAHVQSAILLLPYALASVWIAALAGVCLAALDGCHRADLRALVGAFASPILLLFAWLLVPGRGLVGLAWAQIIQGVFSAAVAWMVLRRRLPGLPSLPSYWRYAYVREMIRYGVTFQAMAILTMLYEPVAKVLMAALGGLAPAAYYDMAVRMVSQVRGLIISGIQVLVPKVADTHERSPGDVRRVYARTYLLVFYVALPLYSALGAGIPLLSELLVGKLGTEFVTFAYLLCAGLAINTITGPAYFVNVGTGALRWNLYGHIVIGVLNVFLAYFAGVAFGAIGVVCGSVAALALGSGTTVLGYHTENNISLRHLWSSDNAWLTVVSLIAPVVAWSASAFALIPHHAVLNAALGFCVGVGPVVAVAWLHPLRRRVIPALAVSR